MTSSRVDGGFPACFAPLAAPDMISARADGAGLASLFGGRVILAAFLVLAATGVTVADAGKVDWREATYRGWKTRRADNGLIEVHVAPDHGGRVIQFRLGEKEFLWGHPCPAGEAVSTNGVGPEVGGETLWAAARNGGGDPWPPDTDPNGGPCEVELLGEGGGGGGPALRLTGKPDPRSGIQFSRVIRIFPDSTRVGFEVTMKNTDVRPQSWGIGANARLDGGIGGRAPNPQLNAYCPLNPGSVFPRAYQVLSGAEDNPSLRPSKTRRLMRVMYKYKAGRIGLDSPAGWAAAVDGAQGKAFAFRFSYDSQKPYPGQMSVVLGMSGPGQDTDKGKADPAATPPVLDVNLFSPMAALSPGESMTWTYDWYAATVASNQAAILNCTPVGVTSMPFLADLKGGTLTLSGHFGVFYPGSLRADVFDRSGKKLAAFEAVKKATPQEAVRVQASKEGVRGAATVALVLCDAAGQEMGELARAVVQTVP